MYDTPGRRKNQGDVPAENSVSAPAIALAKVSPTVRYEVGDAQYLGVFLLEILIHSSKMLLCCVHKASDLESRT